MTIAELISALQDLTDTYGPDWPVYIDSGDSQVSQVEIEERSDEDGPWVALVLGETVWS